MFLTPTKIINWATKSAGEGNCSCWYGNRGGNVSYEYEKQRK